MHYLDLIITCLFIDEHLLQNALLIGNDRPLQINLLVIEDLLLLIDLLSAKDPLLLITLSVMVDLCHLSEIMDTTYSRNTTKALSGEVIVVSLSLLRVLHLLTFYCSAFPSS
jgi:hypothetical protein